MALQQLTQNERTALDAVGGLDGNTQWDTQPFDGGLRAHVLANMCWLTTRINHFMSRCYAEQRFQRRRAEQSLVSRVHKWMVELARGVPTTSTLPSKGKPPPIAREGDEWQHIHVAWGAWNGKQPPGYRGNNSMPRRGILRRFLTVLRQSTMNGQCDKARVVIGVNLQNEDRSSLQCGAGIHLLKDERVNRAPPVRGEHSKHLVDDRPWKLLHCPKCDVILQRDCTAAYNIAMKAAWTRLHQQGKAHKEGVQCLQRWRSLPPRK